MGLTTTGTLKQMAELGFNLEPGETVREIYVARRAKRAAIPPPDTEAAMLLDRIGSGTLRPYRLAAVTDRRIAIFGYSVWRHAPKGVPVVLDAEALGGGIPTPDAPGRYTAMADWAISFPDGSRATLQVMTIRDFASAASAI